MIDPPFDLSRIGAGLPVAAAAEELAAATATGTLVVTAPPGTGKTTFVPPLVAGLVAPARVILTQPRRVSVRAAAARIAALQGEPVGGRVGFTVRGERRISSATVLEIVTPGVLLRRLLRDPELSGVGAVLIDEIHERALDTDLLLGLLIEVRELRGDLLLGAMSATLAGESVASLLGGRTKPAPLVDIPSALHPLDIAYEPIPEGRLDARGVRRDALRAAARTAYTARLDGDDDALVFVPSARDVETVVREIDALTSADTGRGGIEALPLHGRLRSADQDRAVRGRGPGDPPRIIVSTALAESSLTVPGVRIVVDLGLSREVRRDQMRGMTGLVTVSAARASAVQRAGRAAREGPGRVIRLFSETDFARMPADIAPEILAADLLDAALLLAVWGTPGGAGLPLLTSPPRAAMAEAVDQLRTLGLTAENGRVNALGARLAGLPVGVREGRALLDGARLTGDPRLVAEIVAALASGARTPDADLARLLRDLRRGTDAAARSWRRESDRLHRIAAELPREESAVIEGLPGAPEHPEALVLALARPEWIARRTGPDSRSYLLASGTRAALPERSPLLDAEWLVAAAVQRQDGRVSDGTGAVIRLAARMSEAEAIVHGAALQNRRRDSRFVDGRLRVREVEMLGAIRLTERPVAPVPADAVAATTAHIAEQGLSALQWGEAAEQLRRRMGLLHREIGRPWPDVRDAALLDGELGWLANAIAALGPGDPLSRIDVHQALQQLLPWPAASELAALVPERLAVPSGQHARIEYPAVDDLDGRPVVAVKLQEVFGLAETPRLVGGRVPVLFHLLSPARRPLAITGDLASFWDGPYREVRREMRGRYPKHPWPEDPWTAKATAGVRGRPRTPAGKTRD